MRTLAEQADQARSPLPPARIADWRSSWAFSSAPNRTAQAE